MMIPIPQRGDPEERATAIEAARGVPGIEDVRITAKPDQLLEPLPEGGSYLGFIFARGAGPATVVGGAARRARAAAVRRSSASRRLRRDRELTEL